MQQRPAIATNGTKHDTTKSNNKPTMISANQSTHGEHCNRHLPSALPNQPMNNTSQVPSPNQHTGNNSQTQHPSNIPHSSQLTQRPPQRNHTAHAHVRTSNSQPKRHSLHASQANAEQATSWRCCRGLSLRQSTSWLRMRLRSRTLLRLPRQLGGLRRGLNRPSGRGSATMYLIMLLSG